MVAQKIRASASTKGFTLVELIVVITILAILGTIGFISIQGYSAQSRDSKRKSDLRSIASALTIKATEGIALTSFVTPVTAVALSGTTGSGFSLAGTGFAGTDYAAGTPNFTALAISPENFKDGNYDYKIGTSTRNKGVFQIAATLEGDGTKTALTAGNYSYRSAPTFAASGASTTGGSATTYTVSNLTDSGVGFFHKGDFVYLAGTATGGQITSVNGDGRGFAVTLFGSVSAAGTGVTLGGTSTAWAEATGLMGSVLGNTTAAHPVANGSTTALPYTY